jgi:hypothetical protein
MNKEQFLQLLGQSYHFPEYYSLNLDSADEILEDLKEEEEKEKLSLQPFFYALLSEEPEEERKKIWEFLADHFMVEKETPEGERP